MTKQTINVLGTEWTIISISKDEDIRLSNKDGFCDNSTKEIVVAKIKKDPDDIDQIKDLNWYHKKVLRHEIVHAFLFESGLSENWQKQEWGHDETTVDWIAMQAPKLYKVFQELDLL